MDIHTLARDGNLPALQDAVAENACLEELDASGCTVLMAAVASPQASVEVVRFLLDQGGNVNALTAPGERCAPKSVLGIAAGTATLEKIRALVDAGADVTFADDNGYSILLNAVYRYRSEAPERYHAILDFLIRSGAPLDVVSKYGESALRVASYRGDLATVQFLLARGADPKPLGWTPLFFAVAFGTPEQIDNQLDQGGSLDERDSWKRTPFLLSVHAGRLEIAKYLLARGSDRSAKGRCGHTALMYAISREDAVMLKWLIDEGWDVEETDEFGEFPLMQAVRNAACLEVMLEAGACASRRDSYGHGLMESADSREAVELLLAAGEDLTKVNSDMRQRLAGLDSRGDFEAMAVSELAYQQNRSRRFGHSNPERMNNPFWDAMIRTRTSAYSAAARFGESGCQRDAVWCFGRFGQSFTRLSDGRYVEIAGEHEDYYDPDFCIYNDVVVYAGDGTFEIFGYPEQVFPPTDFHTATFFAPYIYIIGCLGYPAQRRVGETPIFRLHCETWKIERVESTGANPGWIYDHKARLIGDKIEVRGGKRIAGKDDDPMENARVFVLDLSNFTWRMTSEHEHHTPGDS
jgi:ankyrin repeat protein